MGFWSDTFGGGNSFSESVANVTTPGDNYEYRGGTLYEGDSPLDPSKYGQETPYGTLGQADSPYTNQLSYSQGSNNPNSSTARANAQAGTPTTLGSNATSDRGGLVNGLGAITRSPVMMGGLGLMTGGLSGLMLGAGGAQIRNNMYGVPQIVDPKATELKGDAAIRAAAGEAMGPGKMTTAGMGEGTSFFGGKRGPDGYTSDIRTAGEPHDRIRGAFYKRDAKGNVDYNKAFKINAFGNSYEIDTDGQNIGNSSQIRRDAEAAALPDDDGGGVAGLRYTPRTQATVPTDGLPAASAESEFAKQQMVSPPVEWLIANGYPDTNPSYDALVKYNTELRSGVASMAEGGDVEFALGGNEKDLINAAERAVRNGLQAQGMARGGELNLSDEDMIALAQYTQQYGVDALLGSGGLVDSVRTGEADETRARFAMGRNGVVRGNGDGSGTDDRVPAKLKEGNSEQDVLLADGEFVLRKDAYEALKDAGVNVDKVNDAGSNAAKELNKMMTA